MLPTDDLYEIARLVKLQQAEIPAALYPLKQWIETTYGVNVLTMRYQPPGPSPQATAILDICLAHTEDWKKLQDEQGFTIRSSVTQAVADQFRTQVQVHSPQVYGDASRRLWVHFTDFEMAARQKANQHIPWEQIAALQQHIGDERLWRIEKGYAAEPVFFLYTNLQLEALQHSSTVQHWSALYFALLAPYDEFGYCQPQLFTIQLDSKENFDTLYKGNWYYYYK